MQRKKQFLKNIILAFIGGLFYVGIELLWRGYSHWTMFLLGGLCFLLIGRINEIMPWKMPLWQQVVIGTIIITGLEFITGCVVNLWLEWNVWDYGDMPLNLLGQICVPYMLLWIPVSLGAILTDDYLRYYLFKEKYPNYYWSKK